ncbi:MAG: hypothetical protein EXS39_07205 [Opitutaceae bacterium]|nr:hypothetical protein [Opitutaceae bacterium]
MGHPRHFRRANHLRRLLAAGCAVLVFALGLFAASPLLHARMMHNIHSSSDDGCAVVLFASGVSAPLGAIAVAPAPTEWREQGRVGSTEIFLDSPRYLLQPERGPPVG